VVIAFGVMAGIICFIYGFYSILIMRGKTQEFEGEMQGALSLWLQEDEGRVGVKLWGILAISLLIEIAYFVLALMVLHNPVMTILTLILIGEELLHIYVVIKSFYKYVRGRIEDDKIFKWLMERVSALFLFTHAFLALVSLFFYN